MQYLCSSTLNKLLSFCRPLTYPDTNVILMCFSIAEPDSLENITIRWLPEVTRFCPTVPFVLVGNKKDLRNDPEISNKLAERKQKPVSREAGPLIASCIKAFTYLECSAKMGEGIREIFDTAARASLQRKKVAKNWKCRLLWWSRPHLTSMLVVYDLEKKCILGNMSYYF